MRLFPILAFLLLLPLSALAATKTSSAPHTLGAFGNWRAYAITEGKQSLCYMTLAEHFPKSKTFPRGDALLTITHRPAEGSKDVISYTAGYNYKPLSDAQLRIGKDAYNLFTAQDTAWSRDTATDHKIAAALRAAPSLTLTGTPAKKGAKVQTDKITLTGADAAYRAISKACGIEVAAAPSAPHAPKAKTKPRPKAKAKPAQHH